MKTVRLTGLDASNPLGFLAALGALRILSQRGEARLSWLDEGRWTAALHLPEDTPDPAALLFEHAQSWKDARELDLQYDKIEKNKTKRVRDLKPEPARFRAFLATAANTASPADRRLADFAAAYGSDVVQDNNGNTKPTAFHFTAGQQSFLDMVVEITEGLTLEHLTEAIYGPWRREADLPLLRWDVSGERLYALMASNPGTEKARGVPGADWLAFQALPFFPCFPVGSRLMTTGFVSRDRILSLRWPVWTAPARLDSVRTLLAQPLKHPEYGSRGVALVFEANVRRSDRGYATFGAATVD